MSNPQSQADALTKQQKEQARKRQEGESMKDFKARRRRETSSYLRTNAEKARDQAIADQAAQDAYHKKETYIDESGQKRTRHTGSRFSSAYSPDQRKQIAEASYESYRKTKKEAESRGETIKKFSIAVSDEGRVTPKATFRKKQSKPQPSQTDRQIHGSDTFSSSTSGNPYKPGTVDYYKHQLKQPPSGDRPTSFVVETPGKYGTFTSEELFAGSDVRYDDAGRPISINLDDAVVQKYNLQGKVVIGQEGGEYFSEYVATEAEQGDLFGYSTTYSMSESQRTQLGYEALKNVAGRGETVTKEAINKEVGHLASTKYADGIPGQLTAEEKRTYTNTAYASWKAGQIQQGFLEEKTHPVWGKATFFKEKGGSPFLLTDYDQQLLIKAGNKPEDVLSIATLGKQYGTYRAEVQAARHDLSMSRKAYADEIRAKKAEAKKLGGEYVVISRDEQGYITEHDIINIPEKSFRERYGTTPDSVYGKNVGADFLFGTGSAVAQFGDIVGIPSARPTVIGEAERLLIEDLEYTSDKTRQSRSGATVYVSDETRKKQAEGFAELAPIVAEQPFRVAGEALPEVAISIATMGIGKPIGSAVRTVGALRRGEGQVKLIITTPYRGTGKIGGVPVLSHGDPRGFKSGAFGLSGKPAAGAGSRTLDDVSLTLKNLGRNLNRPGGLYSTVKLGRGYFSGTKIELKYVPNKAVIEPTVAPETNVLEGFTRIAKDPPKGASPKDIPNIDKKLIDARKDKSKAIRDGDASAAQDADFKIANLERKGITARRQSDIDNLIKNQIDPYHNTPKSLLRFYDEIPNDPILRAKVLKTEQLLNKPRAKLANVNERIDTANQAKNQLDNEALELRRQLDEGKDPLTGIERNPAASRELEARINHVTNEQNSLASHTATLFDEKNVILGKIDEITIRRRVKRADFLGAKQRIFGIEFKKALGPGEKLAEKKITKMSAPGLDASSVGGKKVDDFSDFKPKTGKESTKIKDKIYPGKDTGAKVPRSQKTSDIDKELAKDTKFGRPDEPFFVGKLDELAVAGAKKEPIDIAGLFKPTDLTVQFNPSGAIRKVGKKAQDIGFKLVDTKGKKNARQQPGNLQTLRGKQKIKDIDKSFNESYESGGKGVTILESRPLEGKTLPKSKKKGKNIPVPIHSLGQEQRLDRPHHRQTSPQPEGDYEFYSYPEQPTAIKTPSKLRGGTIPKSGSDSVTSILHVQKVDEGGRFWNPEGGWIKSPENVLDIINVKPRPTPPVHITDLGSKIGQVTNVTPVQTPDQIITPFETFEPFGATVQRLKEPTKTPTKTPTTTTQRNKFRAPLRPLFAGSGYPLGLGRQERRGATGIGDFSVANILYPSYSIVGKSKNDFQRKGAIDLLGGKTMDGILGFNVSPKRKKKGKKGRKSSFIGVSI